MHQRHRSRPVANFGPRTSALLVLLALIGGLTIGGLVTLWPDPANKAALQEEISYTAPGVTFVNGIVDEIQSVCEDERYVDETCGNLTATPTEGPEKGEAQLVPVPDLHVQPRIEVGDQIRLMRIPPIDDLGAHYTFDGIDRTWPLLFFGALFVVIVVGVARLRGALALLSLGFGGVILFGFMIPALLAGSSGMAVALTGSSAIMFVVLYLTHGPSVRTSTALAGTLAGVVVAVAAGELAVHMTRLTGVSDEETAMLSALAGNQLMPHLLICALVVAGLGVINDITIAQSSAVWELRAVGPHLSRWELFTSGMRIGRDHIASTIYTIVFAYAGSAMSVLLLISLYARPVRELISTEPITQELVFTLSSGIGLVAAVPITTAIAAWTVSGPRRRQRTDRLDHPSEA